MMVKMMMIASLVLYRPTWLEHGVQRVEQRFLRHHVGEHDAEHDPGVALDLADAEREGVEHRQHDRRDSHH